MTSSQPPALGDQSLPLASATALQVREGTRKALIRHRPFVFIWRLLIIAVCLTGIVINSWNSGFFPSLVLFTIQSNLFLAAYTGYAAWILINSKSGSRPVLAGAAILYISITGLVFNLLLAKGPVLLSGSANSILLHFFAPIMAALDWLLFMEHGHLRWRNALYWLSYLLGYLIFCLIRGPFVTSGSHYPYFFVDVDKIGYGGVALNTLIYGAAFWLLGMLLIFLDHTLIRWRPDL